MTGTLTFRGFDLTNQNAVPGALTVGVVVELDRPGLDSVVLEPSVVSSDGGVQPVAVDIPGVVGAKLRATGMSVDQGVVRVELLGLGGGIGRTVVLSKGETLAYKELQITFDDFDLSDFDPEAGKINFGVVFTVEHGGEIIEVVPTYRGGMGGEPQVTPAMVPGNRRESPSARGASTPKRARCNSRSTIHRWPPKARSQPVWWSMCRPNR